MTNTPAQRPSFSHTGSVRSLVLEQARFDDHAVQALLNDWNHELIATVPGFAPRGGSIVQATEFERPNGVFLLAMSDDRAVGCGGVRRIGLDIGEVKRLYVCRTARGHGTGRALLRRLEQHARELGLAKIRLDTAGDQPIAMALFRSAGYQPIDDYNGNPYAHYWFEKSLPVRK